MKVVAPSNYEEADTRVLLHANNASQSGKKKAPLVIGTGTYFSHLEIHLITAALSPAKLKYLPLFHAFTGCDTASFYAGGKKEAAWNIRNYFGQLLSSFFLFISSMLFLPKLEDKTNYSASIERFVVLLQDCTSTILTVE